MMSFLNWQLKHILFEEDWEFPTSSSVSALRERLKQNGVDMDEKFRGNVKHDYKNDVYLIRSPAAKIANSLLFFNYYFVGNIKEKDGFVYICGEYRGNSFRRSAVLIGLNLSFVMIFFLLISPFTVPDHFTDLFKLEAKDLLVFVMFYLAAFGFFGAVYLFAFLFTKLEKMGRNDIYDFLVDITLKRGETGSGLES